ncbi:hypothetical protein BDW02DRAFT_257321 [Decorospora gaudefroyi]|uniref:Thymidylate kinase n=1 Tax=Decorospora gaudefroyi TaxID=184978 RepID=A0A6A5KJ30_9PLEO|nr:hypothetical protein BDW02DRAFT_257321 [Decorospora gaudefroyi]
MATFTRQPFAEIGTSRLQVLQSAKNRQNAISKLASPQNLKPSPAPSTGKRQRAPEIYEDVDSENMDPAVFNSPTKKSKTSNSNDAGYVKPAQFSLFTSPTATPPMPSIRKALSSPNTAKSTPITNSRGSPKNKRLHAISKRRASSSPFRRVDPPSFTQSSPSLPFSIDAALSGSIPSYTPKAPCVAATPASTPVHVSTLDECMPKGWFFDIHEDTAEQEAANLMEHSASVLDISSDDDVETKARNEDRGKENIPPPDFCASQQPRLQAVGADADAGEETEIEGPVQKQRARRFRAFVQDAMDEDRKPLGDLAPSEFYAEGCDASSYVTVDVGMERPSGLSREVEVGCQTPEKKVVDVPAAVVVEEKETAVAVHDEDKTGIVVDDVPVVQVPVVDAAPQASPSPSQVPITAS